MTNEKRPLKVFLCHASADKPKVRELYRYLKRRGIQPWLDAENLIPGHKWEEEIPKALDTSDAIVICLSKNSVDKEGYVQTEISFALNKALQIPEGRIFLIPARLEECEVPYGLKKYQWVDLFDEGGYSRLMKSLKERASQLERAAVQVSKQDENSPYLTEKPKQESYEGVSVDVNSNVLGNIIVGNENTVQSQTLQSDLEKPVIAKSSIGIGKNEQRITDFDNYSKTVTPYEHFIKLEQGDPDAIVYQEYIEQNPELSNLVKNMGDVLKHVTFRQGLLLTPHVVSPILEKPFEAKSSIAEPKIEPRKPVLHPSPITELAKPPRKLKTEYIVAIIGAAATILAALIGILPQFLKPAPAPTVTSIATIALTKAPTATFIVLYPTKTTKPPTATNSVAPSPIPTITSTFAPINSPTALPAEIVDSYGIKMKLVPAGEFIMGSDNGNTDEQPVHNVYLDAYYIDKFEVTNALYKACVDAGSCEPPGHVGSQRFTPKFGPGAIVSFDYYGFSQFDNYPVANMTWSKANNYCMWRHKKLPTEAQWEKAARGIDGRIYPWGNDIYKAANYNGVAGGTTPVGSYESSKSVYGVYDMAGNVWEWVADWYSETYYQISPSANPVGPASGQYRVLRGGDSNSERKDIRTTSRWYSQYQDDYFASYGFRCANAVP